MPRGRVGATVCMADGTMGGFITNARSGKKSCADPIDPACSNGTVIDVMGFHTEAELPNYWAYAGNFVLQDHMFQPNASWSFPQHLYMVSGWSAVCDPPDAPMSCATNIDSPGTPFPDAGKPVRALQEKREFAWTDITYLLHHSGVSWKYYLGEGDDPHCGNDPEECQPTQITTRVSSSWNVLPGFDTVKEDKELGNIVPIDEFYQDIAAGQFPSVAWVAPAFDVSEHPTAAVSVGVEIDGLP